LSKAGVGVVDGAVDLVHYTKTGEGLGHVVINNAAAAPADALQHHWNETAGSTPKFAQHGIPAGLWTAFGMIPTVGVATYGFEAFDSCVLNGAI